jgi:hypothetical protein
VTDCEAELPAPILQLDPHTFGNSPAAVVLIDKLNKELRDEPLAKRVIKFIHTTQNGFCRLSEIENNDWFNRFRILWVKERMSLVDFHPDIDTYVKNVIRTDSKEWFRSTLTPKQQARLPKYPKMTRDGILVSD